MVKIEEMAEESGMTQYVAANNKYLERFAQLVIEECISACATDQLGKTVGAAELIRSRFGVE